MKIARGGGVSGEAIGLFKTQWMYVLLARHYLVSLEIHNSLQANAPGHKTQALPMLAVIEAVMVMSMKMPPGTQGLRQIIQYGETVRVGRACLMGHQDIRVFGAQRVIVVHKDAAEVLTVFP